MGMEMLLLLWDSYRQMKVNETSIATSGCPATAFPNGNTGKQTEIFYQNQEILTAQYKEL